MRIPSPCCVSTERVSSCFLRLVLLAGLPAAVMGCGPTDAQIGAAVLVASPVFVAVSWGILAMLARLWRYVDPTIVMRHRPALVTLAVSLLGFVPAFAGPAHWGTSMGEYVFLAILLLGTVYLLLLLTAWRVWFAFRRDAAFSWVIVVPSLALIPAVPASLELLESLQIAHAYVYVAIGGLYGWPVLLVLLAVFVADPLVRARSRRAVTARS